MKYLKISKFTKIAFISSLLTGAILAPTIPLIIQSNNIKNSSTNHSDTKERITTGKIIHGSDTQVVSSVDDIVLDDVSRNSVSRNAVINKNGVQELYVWGLNTSGQLGLGHFNNTIYPVKFNLEQFGKYDTIDFQYNDEFGTSYAIVTEMDIKRLYLWGINKNGQMGFNHKNNLHTPELVNTISLNNSDSIDKVYITEGNIFIITWKNDIKNKLLFGAGKNDFGQLADGFTTSLSVFKQINLANNIGIIKFSSNFNVQSVIIDTLAGQELYVWGLNTSGQLGFPGNNNNVLSPTKHTNVIFNFTKLPSLEVSFGNSSYAWDRTLSELYVWGKNNVGQLGVSTSPSINTPTPLPISLLGNGVIFDVNIGTHDTSYAIVQINGNFEIYVWGLNTSGQLGLAGNTTNVLEPKPFNMISIGSPTTIIDFNLGSFTTQTALAATTFQSSYALVEVDNKLEYYTWGANTYGQLGIGTTTSQTSPQPIAIDGTTIVDAWLTNGVSSMIVNKNGLKQNYVCGFNQDGRLGIADTNDQFRMVQSLRVNEQTEFSLNKNPTFDISSTDAFNQMYNSNGQISQELLGLYMSITNAPTNMELNLIDFNSNFTQGILNITFAPSIIFPPLSTQPIKSNEHMTFSISGFRKVSPIEVNKVVAFKSVPNNLNADELYNAVTNDNGIVTNLPLLSKYIDLTSIPQNAQIRLERIDNYDKNKLDLKLFSNLYYGTRGETIENLNSEGVLVDYQIDVNIFIDILPIALIVSLSVAGPILLIILIVLFAKFLAKRKAVRSYKDYWEL